MKQKATLNNIIFLSIKNKYVHKDSKSNRTRRYSKSWTNNRVQITPRLYFSDITFNGGIPDKSLFCDTEDEEEGYEISFYLPIKHYSDDLGEMKIEKSYAKLTSVNVPSHYLPFAVDWGGNYFAIDLQSGNIVLLFMDLGEFTEDCIEYLAESYSEFVENLVKAED